MDKPKSKVVKSKSSNSAITNKNQETKRNKKSRSNAEFRPFTLKRRGVYVEKKKYNNLTIERDRSSVGKSVGRPVLPKKLSSRSVPRREKKRFLNSILKILSQSTTGTQFPDVDTDRDRKHETIKMKLKKQDNIPENSITSRSSKKKQKYRSRILNKKDSEVQPIVVLKSTREITHTPSNYSEKSSKDLRNSTVPFNWSEILQPLVEKRDPAERKVKQLKCINTQEIPVGKHFSKPIAEAPKDDKKLYNFFVDLLETSFSVYNVKTEFGPQMCSAKSSEVDFEMDEAVAKKLNIERGKDIEDCNKTPSNNYVYNIRPDEEPWDNRQILEHLRQNSSKQYRTTPTKSLKRRQKLHSDSFDHKKPIPKTNSVTMPYKRKKERKTKKYFINLLKEELKMDDDAFEEPRDFFQALKVIAKNKRRCQKSIHITDSKKTSEADFHVCRLKRRKLLSSKSRRRKWLPDNEFKPRHSFAQSSEFQTKSRKSTISNFQKILEKDIQPSQLSLEVSGYHYKPVVKKVRVEKIGDLNDYPPSASTSIQCYNINQALLRRDSTSYIENQIGWWSPSMGQ